MPSRRAYPVQGLVEDTHAAARLLYRAGRLGQPEGVRVLGVDPGLTRCGLGVVRSLPGRQVALVHVEVLRTPAHADLPDRLVEVACAVEDSIAAHRPDVVAIERVFSQNNVMSVMGTAQASGVAMLVAARAGLPVVLHTPTEVKAAVTGSGRAGKAQVTAMVTRILGLDEAPSPADAADALAIGIAQLWRNRGLDDVPTSRQTPAQKAWAEAMAQSNRRSRYPNGRTGAP